MNRWSVEWIAGSEGNLSHENQIDYQQYWECNPQSWVSHAIWIWTRSAANSTRLASKSLYIWEQKKQYNEMMLIYWDFHSWGHVSPVLMQECHTFRTHLHKLQLLANFPIPNPPTMVIATLICIGTWLLTNADPLLDDAAFGALHREVFTPWLDISVSPHILHHTFRCEVDDWGMPP